MPLPTRLWGQARWLQPRGRRRSNTSLPPPQWVGTPAPNFTAGQSGSYNVTALVNDETSISLESGALPTGVTFNGAAFVATTQTTGGTSGPFVLRAYNAYGSSPSNQFSIVITAVAPVWSSTPSFSITEGQPSGPTALPVTVSSGTVSISWLATSTPSTQPTWISFQDGNPPTITFSGAQTDGEDINASMNLRATANAQTADRNGGSITVASATPSFSTVPTISFTFGTPSSPGYDLTTHTTNFNSSIHIMSLAEDSTALPTGVGPVTAAGRLPYNGTGPVTSVSNVKLKIVSTAESDWNARISDPNVVWYHDFRSDAEVNAFRWTNGYGSGNDPLAQGSNATYVRRITSDGIDAGGGTGCLEIVWPSSGQYGNSNWWRPFSPLTGASNGRGVDDPAANGTITIRSHVATNGGNQTSTFLYGYYGDPDNWSSWPGRFDGGDYYIQMRVKMDPARITAGLNPGGNQFGKLLYLTITPFSASAQEINTESYQPGFAGRNYFSMYRSVSPPLENDTPGQGNQPGNAAGIVWFADSSANNAFYWPSPAKWVTLLYYIKPMITEKNATVVRVWKAVAGETSYTKIWDQTVIPLPYEFPGYPFGQNAFLFTSYQNQLVANNGFYHRMAQVIFKKGDGTGSLASGIACPNDPVQQG